MAEEGFRAGGGGEERDRKRRRKKRSRWGNPEEKVAVPDQAALIAKNMTPEQTQAYLVKVQLEDLERKIANPRAYIPSDPRDRSPSPPPIYDQRGKRLNTREERTRQKFEKERNDIVRKAMWTIPGYRPPRGLKVDTSIQKRVFVPVDKYPDYNFIGLILGPRGNTQKRMERETNTRISIRGKGSVKSGRARSAPRPGDELPLHVLITGQDEQDVERAVEAVEKLLVPMDEEHNHHKAQQLRELAVINGTLRDHLICRSCGETGHHPNDCPQRRDKWQPANVLCSICGDASHPAADCPMRASKAPTMTDEFEDFMAELNGDDQRKKQPQQQHQHANGRPGPPPLAAPAPPVDGYRHPQQAPPPSQHQHGPPPMLPGYERAPPQHSGPPPLMDRHQAPPYQAPPPPLRGRPYEDRGAVKRKRGPEGSDTEDGEIRDDDDDHQRRHHGHPPPPLAQQHRPPPPANLDDMRKARLQMMQGGGGGGGGGGHRGGRRGHSDVHNRRPMQPPPRSHPPSHPPPSEPVHPPPSLPPPRRPQYPPQDPYAHFYQQDQPDQPPPQQQQQPPPYNPYDPYDRPPYDPYAAAQQQQQYPSYQPQQQQPQQPPPPPPGHNL